MASGMASSNSMAQVQKLYYRDDNTKLDYCFHITHCSQMFDKFLMLKNKADSRVLPTAQDLGPNISFLSRVCKIVWDFGWQNGEETQWFSTQERDGQPSFFIDTSRSPETFFKHRMYWIHWEVAKWLPPVYSRSFRQDFRWEQSSCWVLGNHSRWSFHFYSNKPTKNRPELVQNHCP